MWEFMLVCVVEIVWRGLYAWIYHEVINPCYENDKRCRYLSMIAGDMEVRIGETHPNLKEGF